MGKLLPILLAVMGVVAGGAAGYVMKPAPEEAAMGDDDPAAAEARAAEERFAYAGQVGDAPEQASDSAYVPLSRKLIVPFTRESGRKAFVAIDVTLEMAPDEAGWATTHEPKIIDAFLRTLVGFASTGAFDDHKQAAHTLRELNVELYKSARAVLGPPIRKVLIANLITQDA